MRKRYLILAAIAFLVGVGVGLTEEYKACNYEGSFG